MSDSPLARDPRSTDSHPRFRVVALTAVVAGVVLVAVAAFFLSYAGVHRIALQAGVTPKLARLYPPMFDAMLIVAASAVLALRGAGPWAKAYAWGSLLLVLGVVATGDAVHATGVRLDSETDAAAIAVIPWVLLLMAFGLWLAMLRHWRKVRMASAAAGIAGSRAGSATANDGAVIPPAAAPAAVAAAAVAPAAMAPPAPATATPGHPAAAGPAPALALRQPLAPASPSATPEQPAPARIGPADGAVVASPVIGGPGGQPTLNGPGDTPVHDEGDQDEGVRLLPGTGTGGVASQAGGPGKPDPEPVAPEPPPVPHFDRIRSTPTPPDEHEADTE